MGGCATKPRVLKDDADAPQPTGEPNYPVEAQVGGEQDDEAVAEATDGRKSLGNLFKEKEAEEISAVVKEKNAVVGSDI